MQRFGDEVTVHRVSNHLPHTNVRKFFRRCVESQPVDRTNGGITFRGNAQILVFFKTFDFLAACHEGVNVGITILHRDQQSGGVLDDPDNDLI